MGDGGDNSGAWWADANARDGAEAAEPGEVPAPQAPPMPAPPLPAPPVARMQPPLPPNVPSPATLPPRRGPRRVQVVLGGLLVVAGSTLVPVAASLLAVPSIVDFGLGFELMTDGGPSVLSWWTWWTWAGFGGGLLASVAALGAMAAPSFRWFAGVVALLDVCAVVGINLWLGYGPADFVVPEAAGLALSFLGGVLLLTAGRSGRGSPGSAASTYRQAPHAQAGPHLPPGPGWAPQPSPPAAFCPHCRAQVQPGWVACPVCGGSIGTPVPPLRPPGA
jgi:hypothetical protein